MADHTQIDKKVSHHTFHHHHYLHNVLFIKHLKFPLLHLILDGLDNIPMYWEALLIQNRWYQNIVQTTLDPHPHSF